MWAKLTESAKSTVYYAQEEARRLNRAEVEPEQFVYGLVSTQTGEEVENTAAARLLVASGVSRALVLQHFEGTPPLNRVEVDFKNVQLSDRSRQLIDLAFAQQRRLGDGHIGTEHLLLALTQEKVLHEKLAGLGLDSAGVTRRLQELRAANQQPWWQVWKRSRLEP